MRSRVQDSGHRIPPQGDTQGAVVAMVTTKVALSGLP